MKSSLKLPAILEILFFLGLIVGIPLTIISLQQQQEIRSQADEAFWSTSQSASASCPTGSTTVNISVSFTNTEPQKSSTAMNVVAKDLQSGKSITFTNVQGGQTKTGTIQTGKTSVANGTVEFALTWTDGHAGTDKRTATYSSKTCSGPTPTPNLSCPITPASGKIIVNFPNTSLLSNSTEAKAQLGPITTSIPKGAYKITLASYDEHSNKSIQAQPNERYFLKLRNSSGVVASTTNSIKDLPEDTNSLVEVVNTNLNISQDIKSVIAYHTVYPDTSNPNSIIPICAAFEKITPTPTPTTKPSATPTSKPNVTPTVCPTLGPVKNVRIDCPNCP